MAGNTIYVDWTINPFSSNLFAKKMCLFQILTFEYKTKFLHYSTVANGKPTLVSDSVLWTFFVFFHILFAENIYIFKHPFTQVHHRPQDALLVYCKSLMVWSDVACLTAVQRNTELTSAAWAHSFVLLWSGNQLSSYLQNQISYT